MENIRLPSGKVIELRTMTGKDWKECIYNAKKLSVEKGIDLAEVGYWEKYAEIATGFTKQRLEEMPLEDYRYLIDRLMHSKNAGKEGPRESGETRKN